MGAFYGSIIVKSEDRVQITKILESLAKDSNHKFLIGPVINGWISIFPNESGQDLTVSAKLAENIRVDFFQLIVHDDDFFAYHFYRDGKLADQYNSCPDYFDEVSGEEKLSTAGKPEIFANLLVNRSKLPKIKNLLKVDGEVNFAGELMRKFVQLVGIPNAVSSYEYLLDGERDEISGWSRFSEVPDLREEKRLRRLEIKATKKRLKEEGVFLTELLPPGLKKQAIHAYLHFCADSLNGGFLICWASHFRQMAKVPLLSFNPLQSNRESETGIVFNHQFFSFEMSHSGKWFTTSDDKSHVWNWAEKKILFEIEQASPVDQLYYSHDERDLIRVASDNIYITNLETGHTDCRFKIGSGGGRGAALHPSRDYLVTIRQNNLALLNFESGEIEKTLVCKGTTSFDLPNTKETDETIKNIKNFQANYKQTNPPLEHNFVLTARVIGRMIVYQTTEGITKIAFNPNGDMLFCGTSKGLRIFRWNEFLLAVGKTPKPIFSADSPTDDPNSDYVHDFFLDESRNQVVFCGSFGKVCYLNLHTGKSGVLLDPPGEFSIRQMSLAKDGIVLGCKCSPIFKERNREVARLQFWNYPALCKAAGV